MKKIIAILLCMLVLLGCLAACAPAADPGKTPDSGKTPTENPGKTPEDPKPQNPDPNPGTDPGTNPGTDPGTNPGTNPGTDPDPKPEDPKPQVVDETKTVSKLSVEKEPDKVYYEVGEEFTVEGGIVLVTYTDGTTQSLPMTSPSFTIAAPSTSAVGTKNINVRSANNKKCTFTVRVANKSFNITYNLNYQGAPAPEVVSVVKGQKAESKTPVREGYTFVAWYANKDYIYQYDFSKGVTDAAELFALWKKDGAEYFDVTFDHGYYGDLYQTYSYPVQSGTTVSKPSDPVRLGYKFSKWLDANGTEFDFSKPITSAVTITASWTKTVTGTQTYQFEAEDTSLKGKVGPAFSGTCSEEAMIVSAPENRGCSNDRFVSFLYRSENSLEFYIACDEELTDVTLYARLSAELRDFTFNPSNYAIEVNDEPMNYDPISFVGVPKPTDAASALDCLPFKDYLIGKNIHLKKGANLIRLITKNSVPMDGSTLEAAAPIVDSIKLETSGVVIWDANRGLPASNY
ncbi:MAG: InlB B-repeat-containing protein [Oscillospiraceae bacterium]|nr:InlB B-repeat-containing protein [Oscillospiraceae bacterium]